MKILVLLGVLMGARLYAAPRILFVRESQTPTSLTKVEVCSVPQLSEVFEIVTPKEITWAARLNPGKYATKALGFAELASTIIQATKADLLVSERGFVLAAQRGKSPTKIADASIPEATGRCSIGTQLIKALTNTLGYNAVVSRQQQAHGVLRVSLMQGAMDTERQPKQAIIYADSEERSHVTSEDRVIAIANVLSVGISTANLAVTLSDLAPDEGLPAGTKVLIK